MASWAYPLFFRQPVILKGLATEAARVPAELTIFHTVSDGLLFDTHSLTAFLLKQAWAAAFLHDHLSPG